MAIALSGSLILSGSITVSGSIISTGTISMSGSIASASYATNADLLDGLDSTVFTLTSSFAAQTASFTAFTASILSYTSSQLVLNGTYATTGSNIFTSPQTINSNLIVTGSITAQTLVVQTITSSVDFVTGSTRFGSILGNTHVFSGSVSMNPNGLFVSSSGLVGIGNVVPAYTLDVSGTGRFTGALLATSTSYSNLTLNGTNATDWGNNMAFQSGGTDFGYIGSIGSLLGSTTKDMTIWATAGNGFGVYTNGNNQRLYISSTGAATFSSTINAGGAIKTSGQNSVNEASVLKFSQESSTTSQIAAYGATTGTAGILNIIMKSSDASVNTVALSFASTGAATFTTATNTGITITTPDVVTFKMLGSGGTSTNWGFARSLSAAGDFGIYRSTSVGGDPISAGTSALYFLNTGAATFSGDLYVNGTNKNVQLGSLTLPTTSSNLRHYFAGAATFVGQDGVGEANVGNNFYYNAAFLRRNTDYASNIRFDAGNIYLQVAASGAANSAITWTNAVTIANSGAASFSSGIGIGGATATTGGIQFPATQVSSADANNLDDYEEGTWTAAFNSDTGSITMDNSFKTGRYTKIGRIVNIQLHARFTAISSPTGVLSVSGLPFTSASSNQNRTAGSIIFLDSSAPLLTSIVTYLSNNGSNFIIAGFNQTLLNAASYVKASSEIYIGHSYIVD